MAYQWLFNATNAIAGAVTSTYTIINIVSNQAGAYSAVMSNAYGSVTSVPAYLTLTNSAPIPPPSVMRLRIMQ
jgi:hypothetical protein